MAFDIALGWIFEGLNFEKIIQTIGFAMVSVNLSHNHRSQKGIKKYSILEPFAQRKSMKIR